MDPTSLDMTKVKRPDPDMAIAWTKTYGKGRVFYTALGDAEHVWQGRSLPEAPDRRREVDDGEVTATLMEWCRRQDNPRAFGAAPLF